MKEINIDQAISILNDILEYELAGVVKYTHFALMVTGPNRLTLDKFFKSFFNLIICNFFSFFYFRNVN